MRIEIPANQMPQLALYGEEAMKQLDAVYADVSAQIKAGIGIVTGTNRFPLDREVHHIMLYQLPDVKMPLPGSAAPHPKPKI